MMIASRREARYEAKQQLLHDSELIRRNLDRRSTSISRKHVPDGSRRLSLNDSLNPQRNRQCRPEVGFYDVCHPQQRRASFIEQEAGQVSLERPQPRPCVPTRKKPDIRRYSQASRDDQRASPVDISKLSTSKPINGKSTRRSTLPPLPFYDESKSTHLSTRRSSLHLQSSMNKPPSALAPVDDVLKLIAELKSQTQGTLCRVPMIVSIIHEDDNDGISDISSSDGEDVNDFDNSMQQKTDQLVSDTVNSKFWEEAWYALD
jgi:hypothetical protein